MRRGYSREAYLELAAHVKSRIPGVVLTTDMIVGFCGETESEFAETLSLMREVRYHKQFIYPYSLRQKTHAHRKHEDDVPADVKKDRYE
jgi:tRNA A37 methylthiotransferase MiaB